MRQGETFAATGLDTALFLVGRNRRGQWVAQDQRGARGGLFVSRTEAFKFARRENGNRPELVVDVPDALELAFAGNVFGAPVALAAESFRLAA